MYTQLFYCKNAIILIKMQLSSERKKQTGAFYTPHYWASLAVDYMQKQISDFDEYLFYDPAAGEGALLEALPKRARKIATTLEGQDVEILRQKGIEAYQYDFLKQEVDDLLFWLRWNASEHKGLVVFTNPPYLKLGKDDYCEMKHKYKTNDATLLFIYRILKEIKPAKLAIFSKADIYSSPQSKKHSLRLGLSTRAIFHKGFVCPSFTWSGLKGNFPIVFNIFNGTENDYYDDCGACVIGSPFDIQLLKDGKPYKDGEKIFTY